RPQAPRDGARRAGARRGGARAPRGVRAAARRKQGLVQGRGARPDLGCARRVQLESREGRRDDRRAATHVLSATEGVRPVVSSRLFVTLAALDRRRGGAAEKVRQTARGDAPLKLTASGR